MAEIVSLADRQRQREDVQNKREVETLIDRIKEHHSRQEAYALALPPGREKDVALGWMLSSEAEKAVEDLLDRVRALGGSRDAEEEMLHILAQAVGWHAVERGLDVEELQDSVETGAILHDRCQEDRRPQ